MKRRLTEYFPDMAIAAYLLCSMLISSIPENVYGYIYAYYVLDYSYGFGSRLMIGSLLHLFTGEFVPHQTVRIFVICSLCILCVLLASVIGTCFRSLKEGNTKAGFVFLPVLYLACPASPGYLWTPENLGRLDTFLFLFALIQLQIFFSVKYDKLRFILYAGIACLAITAHQAYVFLFLPSLLVILICECFDEKGLKKSGVIPAVAVLCVIAAAFLYMQFRSGIYYDDVDTLVGELQSHTDGYISDAAMEAEYFWKVRDHFVKNQLPEIRTRMRFGVITAVALAPVWIFYTMIWLKGFHRTKGKRFFRIKYLLIALTNLCYVPIFVLMTDWGRWWAALFSVQILNTMVLLFSKDEGIGAGVAYIGDRIQSNGLLYGAIVLYAAWFHKFEAARFLPEVENLYYHLYAFKTWLMHAGG